MNRLLTAFIMGLFVTAGAVGAEAFEAEILYLEGDVSVHRQGAELDWDQVDVGTPLEFYDLIETGDDGYAEIEISGSRPMTLRVRSGSALYLSQTLQPDRSVTEVKMLSGTLGLKVKKLASASRDIAVRTDSMVMGVRGTEFEVAVSADGSILVTCSEGSVACEDEDGSVYGAGPGAVVRKDSQMQAQIMPIAVEDLDSYREFWRGQRDEIFRRSARMIIPAYARRHLRLSAKFRVQYQKALRHQKALEEYLKAPSNDMAQVVALKRAVSADLMRLRSGLNLMEHNFFALQRMKSYMNDDITGEFVTEQRRLGDFFGDFARESESMKRQLASARHLLRLYGDLSRVSGAAIPVETMDFGGNPLDF